jgi:hypothetical protein
VEIYPNIKAVDFVRWLSKPFSVKVDRWVRRFLEGDITLVKDVVDQYDEKHDTTSTIVVSTVENGLLSEEKEKMSLRERMFFYFYFFCLK